MEKIELTAHQQALEDAFKAGYHCLWHRDALRYTFDPALSPGDPDGAFRAWLQARARLKGPTNA